MGLISVAAISFYCEGVGVGVGGVGGLLASWIVSLPCVHPFP